MDMHMREVDRGVLSLSSPSAVLSYNMAVFILLNALEGADYGTGANSVSFCVISAPSPSFAIGAMIDWTGPSTLLVSHLRIIS